MGLLDWMFGKKITEPQTKTGFKMFVDADNGFFNWGGNLYHSDVVRSCIRPKAKAVGKLTAKHIKDGPNFKTNPNYNIKLLLEEPNPLMTGQVFQEKMATQLELNNNAFALIKRDEEFQPIEIYPLPAISVELLEGPLGDMYLKFTFKDGKSLVAPYVDVIHLRQDFNEHNVFGDAPGEALANLMEVVNTIDQGMMKAIKNSAIIRWIMKFDQVLRPEDIDAQIKKVNENYMSVENDGGVIPTNPGYSLEQVKPQSYVPDDKQTMNTTQRIYNFFNTNDKIVQSKYNEDEWNAYYESVIQPVAMQLSGEYTRKIFDRRQRRLGNKITFESFNLQYASMSTKINLVQLMDRGALTPNEWRKIMNMGPVEGGDKPLRRLDTTTVNNEGGDNSGQDGETGTDNEQDRT